MHASWGTGLYSYIYIYIDTYVYMCLCYDPWHNTWSGEIVNDLLCICHGNKFTVIMIFVITVVINICCLT